MRTKFLFLTLAGLTVHSTHARAMTAPQDADPVELPAYAVESPRYLPVEKAIAANLRELRAHAQQPMALFAELPALRAPAAAVFTGKEFKTAQRPSAAAPVAKG